MRDVVQIPGRPARRLVLLGLLLLLSATRSRGEEGMWTFDNPPSQALAEKYHFIPAPSWLDHVRLSSVRFNDGGSGSFVSPNGLVLTNHHVASGQLAKVSSAKKDFRKNGFYARTRAEEIRCPDLELNVLESTEDVTAKVQGAVKKEMNDAEALKARRAEMARIEKESLDATGLRSDVITLYHGGEYWLYRYRKYTDVRIVFAPEGQIAYYGGDPDNFTYPRHDLDMALFRVYENGRPVRSPNYLKWNPKGAEAGDLVFVSGNPGNTRRLATVAELETDRDLLLPLRLKGLRRSAEVLRAYAAADPEQARQAAAPIQSIDNSIKALSGMLHGVSNPRVLEAKRAQEEELRDKVSAESDLERPYGDAWDEIARAEKKQRKLALATYHTRLRGYRLTNLALPIVRYAVEVAKPDSERLREFHEAGLGSLRFQLLSPAPFYPRMEAALLAASLQMARDDLGAGDPFVAAALEGKDPEAVAKEVMLGTKLADPAFRKALLEGGEAAIAASTDPLIALARRIDPVERALRKKNEDQVESVELAAGEKIGKARFAIYGKSEYPDATFTLRLSYGTVKGFPMNGTQAPPFTTLYGLYDRALSFGAPPYDLPPRYLQRRASLDLSTRLNFVTTNDVIGGNSGSPVVDRRGELVGLIFDGNIESLTGDYLYEPEVNRSVAVHPAAMVHLLRKIYDAPALADELEGKQRAASERP